MSSVNRESIQGSCEGAGGSQQGEVFWSWPGKWSSSWSPSDLHSGLQQSWSCSTGGSAVWAYRLGVPIIFGLEQVLDRNRKPLVWSTLVPHPGSYLVPYPGFWPILVSGQLCFLVLIP